MNNFVWEAKKVFFISGTSQAYFGNFKGLYQCRYYFRECLYSQTSLKAWDSKEKLAFLSRLPLSLHIAWLATFSIYPGILISFYASAHHPYTTLATGEWMIFCPGEDSPVEIESAKLAAILYSSHPCLYCKVAKATLQFVLLHIKCIDVFGIGDGVVHYVTNFLSVHLAHIICCHFFW